MIASAKSGRAGAVEPHGYSSEEFDLGVAEMRDLCDRYAGRDQRRLRKVSFWMQSRVCGLRYVLIASIANRDERTVREHVEDVDRHLRIMYGPNIGHPVEYYLRFTRLPAAA